MLYLKSEASPGRACDYGLFQVLHITKLDSFLSLQIWFPHLALLSSKITSANIFFTISYKQMVPIHIIHNFLTKKMNHPTCGFLPDPPRHCGPCWLGFISTSAVGFCTLVLAVAMASCFSPAFHNPVSCQRQQQRNTNFDIYTCTPIPLCSQPWSLPEFIFYINLL